MEGGFPSVAARLHFLRSTCVLIELILDLSRPVIVNSNKEEPNNTDIENNQQTIQEETKKNTDIDSDTPSEKNEQPNELKQDKKTSTLEETKNVGDNDTSLTSKEEITENSNKR